MPTLNADLRSALAGHVLRARRIVTEGVRDAVDRLAVERHEPFGTMSIAEREVRTRLRARGRQLGDERDPARGTQDIGKLVATAAYEHWHRMLFARVLAANNLLFDPDGGPRVALSINDVRDRANTEGRTWPEVAARFAQRLLPQIFRPDDPIFEMRLSIEATQVLEATLDAIPAVVFSADDGLGWVYQYWQADERDRVNATGGTIGATELPAVTQLFTEDYMVWFLLHNTLGAWWAGKMLASNPILARDAADESALRAACALPGVDWAYLRFVREGDAWRPASGTFPGWPKAARDITVLDPCMGSGHFLVFALPILAAMRVAEEGKTFADALDATLQENLFGLELDPRCTQLAAFNLALTAWRTAGFRNLAQINVACSGLPLQAKTLLEGAEKPPLRIREGLDALESLFAKAPDLGSLINPLAIGDDLGIYAGAAEIIPLVSKIQDLSAELREAGIQAHGALKSAVLLSKKYTLVVTNPPFLGSNKFNNILSTYAERFHNNARFDLAFMFLERCGSLSELDCSLGIVLPQTFFALKRQGAIRAQLLREHKINSATPLGTNAFAAISGEVVNVTLLISSNSRPHGSSEFSVVTGLGGLGYSAKLTDIRSNKCLSLNQLAQTRNPDFSILFREYNNEPTLQDFATSWHGFVTGDNNRFYIKHWEIINKKQTWEQVFRAPKVSALFSGRENYIRWEQDRGALRLGRATNFPPDRLKAAKGVLVSGIGQFRATIFGGGIFDAAAVAFIPHEHYNTFPLLTYTYSSEFSISVREQCQKPSVAPGYFLRIPFDEHKWTSESQKHFGQNVPAGFSDDATQWLFHGHPFGSVIWDTSSKRTAHGLKRTDLSVLQVAVARLLGYRWPAELDPSMDLAAEQREWVDRCDELVQHADPDGIVCLPSVKGERPAAERLAELLGAAYGDGWSDTVLRDLVQTADPKASDLGDWLNRSFFKQHCDAFDQRPFIWHVWDGEADGFGALVNYHRLAGPGDDGSSTLQSLTYTYLGDWITRQRQDKASGVTGAERRLAAAISLRRQLDSILGGEAPYDLFVRWKPLHEQPIGWRPDIDDGVRLNVRPFLTASLGPVGARPTGLLRSKPRIDYIKGDLGSDTLKAIEDFPWMWGATGDETDFMGREPTSRGAGGFDGKRWNGMHYTLGAKQAARARQAGR